jgi:hypothetical protein
MFALQKLSVLKFCNPIENLLSKENIHYQRNTTFLKPPEKSGGFVLQRPTGPRETVSGSVFINTGSVI